MEGVLNHGDSILINHAETDPRDGLYVLRIGNDLFVKRVQRISGQTACNVRKSTLRTV